MDFLKFDWLEHTRSRYHRVHGVFPPMKKNGKQFFITSWPDQLFFRAVDKCTMALMRGGAPAEVLDCPLMILSHLCSIVVRYGYLPKHCRDTTLSIVLQEIVRDIGLPPVAPPRPNWQEDLKAAIRSGEQPKVLDALRRTYLPMPDPLNPGKQHGDCECPSEKCIVLYRRK